MDLRLLAPLTLAGILALTWAPTLQPPPRRPLEDALDEPGPAEVEGIVASIRDGGSSETYWLVRNGSHVWIQVRDPPPVAPGARVRATVRPAGGVLLADGADVDVLVRTEAVLLRTVAREPGPHLGNVTVEATTGDVFKTVMYLRDDGHRLRVRPGATRWPSNLAKGERVVATGRLVYRAERMAYVLQLDGIDHA